MSSIVSVSISKTPLDKSQKTRNIKYCSLLFGEFKMNTSRPKPVTKAQQEKLHKENLATELESTNYDIYWLHEHKIGDRHMDLQPVIDKCMTHLTQLKDGSVQLTRDNLDTLIEMADALDHKIDEINRSMNPLQRPEKPSFVD